MSSCGTIFLIHNIHTSGPCVILIGPEEHAKRHCDPEPLYLVDSEDWRLANQLRLAGDDLIAVYVRKGVAT